MRRTLLGSSAGLTLWPARNAATPTRPTPHSGRVNPCDLLASNLNLAGSPRPRLPANLRSPFFPDPTRARSSSELALPTSLPRSTASLRHYTTQPQIRLTTHPRSECRPRMQTVVISGPCRPSPHPPAPNRPPRTTRTTTAHHPCPGPSASRLTCRPITDTLPALLPTCLLTVPRGSSACNHCRDRKVKCDGTRPGKHPS